MAIEVNGTSYDSWDDVPQQLRDLVGRVLPDADGNSVPDLIEGKGPLPEGTQTTTHTSIEMGGKTYDSIDQLPPQLQETLGRLMRDEVVRDGKGRRIVTPPTPTVPTAPRPTPAEGQVVLNGVPVDVETAAGTTPKKHWWSRR